MTAGGVDGPLNELGYHAIPGPGDGPRELLVQAAAAERLGFGAAFVADGIGGREGPTESGAVGATTGRIGLATVATNLNTRHPLVVASHGLTMQKLTGGRYTLGIGRGVVAASRSIGRAPVTSAQLADFTWLLRRLWAGETIVDHDGPAGRFPRLSLELSSPERIPLAIAAFGQKTLTMGGRVFDSVVLHPFFTEETTRRAVSTVRAAAEAIGRDPASVRVWSVLAVAGDHLPEDARRRTTIGRLAGYLQRYGDLLVAANGWDPAVLERFSQDIFVRSFDGPIDGRASDSELEHVASLLPEEWLAGAASGTRLQCVAAIEHQFDYGVDGVILEGPSPWELEPVLDAYRLTRDGSRFGHLTPNPGTISRVRAATSRPPVRQPAS